MRNKRPIGRKGQAGFTLAELAVVVIVIGIIAAIIIPRFTGAGAAKSRAQAMLSFADSGQAIIRSSISQMNLPFIEEGSAAANNMITDANDWLDVLVTGPTDAAGANLVKANYVGRYSLTGAAQLSSAVNIVTASTSGTKGTFEVQAYGVDTSSAAAGAAVPVPARANVVDGNGAAPAAGFCGNATSARHFYWVYGPVPTDVVLSLKQALEDKQATLATVAAADTTGVLRYTAAANELHVVCIERQVS